MLSGDENKLIFMVDLWGDPWGTPRSPFRHPGEQTKTWNNHKLWLVKGARYELCVLRLYRSNPYTLWEPHKVPYPYTWFAPGTPRKLVLESIYLPFQALLKFHPRQTSNGFQGHLRCRDRVLSEVLRRCRG